MKRLLGTIVLIGLLPPLATAQGSDFSRGHGYFYVAPGVRGGYDEPGEAILQIGGGAEGFFTRHLGLGVDLGGVRVSGQYRPWFAAFSPNVVLRFRAASDQNKVEPFVTGGYTHFSAYNRNGVNFGAGVNYWFRDHVGLRFEARDSVGLNADAVHFVGVRIGLTFR